MWGEGGGHLHLPPYYQLSKAKQDTMKIIYQRRCAEPSAVVSSSGGGRADMIPAQIGSCIRVSRLHPRSRQCNTHKLYCYQYSATCFDLQVSKFWQCWDTMLCQGWTMSKTEAVLMLRTRQGAALVISNVRILTPADLWQLHVVLLWEHRVLSAALACLTYNPFKYYRPSDHWNLDLTTY